MEVLKPVGPVQSARTRSVAPQRRSDTSPARRPLRPIDLHALRQTHAPRRTRDRARLHPPLPPRPRRGHRRARPGARSRPAILEEPRPEARRPRDVGRVAGREETKDGGQRRRGRHGGRVRERARVVQRRAVDRAPGRTGRRFGAAPRCPTLPLATDAVDLGGAAGATRGGKVACIAYAPTHVTYSRPFAGELAASSRPHDPELLHSEVQRGTFHPETGSRSVGTADDAVRLVQHLKDVSPLKLRELIAAG